MFLLRLPVVEKWLAEIGHVCFHQCGNEMVVQLVTNAYGHEEIPAVKRCVKYIGSLGMRSRIVRRGQTIEVRWRVL